MPASRSRSATRIRCSASTSSRSTGTRCRRTCAATIRTSTAARRPAAIAYGYRFAPSWRRHRRATARASSRRRSTISTIRAFRIPTSCPRRRRTLEGGPLLERRRRARARAKRARSPIATGCRSSSSCNATRASTALPHNVNRATLEGVTLGLDVARRQRRDARRLRSISQSPEDDVTGKLLPRRARRAWRDDGWCSRSGRCALGVELVASSLRYDDPGQSRQDGRLRDRQPDRSNGRSRSGVTLFARGDNVFDKNYQLAAGLRDRRRDGVRGGSVALR